MYIELSHRHYGVHKPIKHIEIPCNFSEVYLGPDRINEKLLLDNIPKGWLPVPSKYILLTVKDENGGTGQGCLDMFRPWAKYFDSYVLNLLEKPLKWWEMVGGKKDDTL